MFTDFFSYDGDAAGAVTPRCAIDDELGLMWSAADLVRLLGLQPANTNQMVNYAPGMSLVAPDCGPRPLRFIAHEVAMHWLHNRLEGQRAWALFTSWALLRKFPKVAAPDGLPRLRDFSVDDPVLSGRAEDVEAAFQRMQTARYHLTDLVCGKPLRVLYLRGKPYVSWPDVCDLLPATMTHLARKTQIGTLKSYFPDHAEHIERVRGRNGDHVIVMTPELVLLIVSLYAVPVYNELVTPSSRGRTKPEVWAQHAVEQPEHTFVATPKSVRDRLFAPGTLRAEQTPAAATEFAAAQFTPIDVMRANIKPE
jgi:hypothetical protein